MILEFNYNGKQRELCVLKFDKNYIEGFELSCFEPFLEGKKKELKEYFSKTSFEDLPKTPVADPEHPEQAFWTYRSEAREDHTEFMKYYRRFNIQKCGIDLNLKVSTESVLQEAAGKLNELNKQLEEATGELEQQIEEELLKEKGEVLLQHIESADTKEKVLKVMCQEGTFMFYAPEKSEDNCDFRQHLECFPNLISFIYNLGRNGVPLTIRESTIQC